MKRPSHFDVSFVPFSFSLSFPFISLSLFSFLVIIINNNNIIIMVNNNNYRASVSSLATRITSANAH